MKDKQGREYAKLSQLKAGDMVELDSGFTCVSAGRHMVHSGCHTSRLYVACVEGTHYLDGQADNGEDLIGVYPCRS